MLIAREIEVFSCRKDKPGVYNTEAARAITAGKFHDVALTPTVSNKDVRNELYKQFNQTLVDSMPARIMS